MATPANDHLRPDPGFVLDTGPLGADLERSDPGYTAVDLSELPASLRQGRAMSSPRAAAPASPPALALDPVRVQEVVQAVLEEQHRGSAGDPGDPASRWGTGTGKGDYGMAGNGMYTGARLDQLGLMYMGPGGGGGSTAPAPSPAGPTGYGPGVYSEAPSNAPSGYPGSGYPSHSSSSGDSASLIAAYNALLAANGNAPSPEPGAEQVVARLPIEPDITHADGHVYVEIVVPYAHARLLSVAATKGILAAVAADGELLYFVPAGAPGLATVTSAVAPKFDEVLLTEGDRIGVLVRFPPMLGATGGFVDVTLYTGAAPHVTVR